MHSRRYLSAPVVPRAQTYRRPQISRTTLLQKLSSGERGKAGEECEVAVMDEDKSHRTACYSPRFIFLFMVSNLVFLPLHRARSKFPQPYVSLDSFPVTSHLPPSVFCSPQPCLLFCLWLSFSLYFSSFLFPPLAHEPVND